MTEEQKAKQEILEKIIKEYVKNECTVPMAIFSEKAEPQTLTSTSANYIINRLTDTVNSIKAEIESISPFDKKLTLANGTILQTVEARNYDFNDYNSPAYNIKGKLDRIADMTAFIAYLSKAIENKNQLVKFYTLLSLPTILDTLSNFDNNLTFTVWKLRRTINTDEDSFVSQYITQKETQRNLSVNDIVKPLAANAKAATYGKILAKDKLHELGKIAKLDAEIKDYIATGCITINGSISSDISITTSHLAPDFNNDEFNALKHSLHKTWRELEADDNHFKAAELKFLEDAKNEAKNIFLDTKAEIDDYKSIFANLIAQYVTESKNLRIVIPNIFTDLYNNVKNNNVE